MAVNRDQVDDVAWFAAVGGRGRFVGREVDRVKDVSEQLIGLGGKEAKVAVSDPFEKDRFLWAVDARGPFTGSLPSYPGEFEPSPDQ